MNKLERQVNQEQIRAIYRMLPTTISALLGAAILIFMLWDFLPHDTLVNWFIIVCLVNGVFSSSLYFYYQRIGQHDSSNPLWQYLIIIFTLATGTLWGSIGIFFYSAPDIYQLLVVGWLWALGAGITSLLVAHKKAFYFMIVPLLVPLATRAAIDADQFHIGLSVATLLWMASLMYFHNINHKTLSEALRLRFKNVELVDELKSKNREIERSNLAKSQFLAEASHDLRQPLHAQGLFLAELDNYVDSSTGRRILGGLESSVHAMQKLLNAILDISKLDAGIVEPSIKTFQIDTLLKTLKDEFEPIAKEKNLELQVRYHKLFVESDPVLLGSILRNLLANAIRYTSDGKISIDCKTKGNNHLVIELKDTGKGIPKDKLEEIFLPFVQLGNPEKDREKGLGLGLAIVYRITELLKHSITVQSEPGRGTEFMIDVPLSDQVYDENDIDQTPSLHKADITGKRVLIIDDEYDIRNSMGGLLKSWGCIPETVGTFNDAMKLIDNKKETFDIILADFSLSDNMTGIQVVEEIRNKTGTKIPAAIITGDTSVERLREANESGYPILHKPVLANDLRNLLVLLAEQP